MEGTDPVLAYPAMPPEAVRAARMYEVVSRPVAWVRVTHCQPHQRVRFPCGELNHHSLTIVSS